MDGLRQYLMSDAHAVFLDAALKGNALSYALRSGAGTTRNLVDTSYILHLLKTHGHCVPNFGGDERSNMATAVAAVARAGFFITAATAVASFGFFAGGYWAPKLASNSLSMSVSTPELPTGVAMPAAICAS